MGIAGLLDEDDHEEVRATILYVRSHIASRFWSLTDESMYL